MQGTVLQFARRSITKSKIVGNVAMADPTESVIASTFGPRPWPSGLKVFWLLLGGFACLIGGVLMVHRLTPPIQNPHARDFFRQWISARNYMADQSIYLELSKGVKLHGDEQYGMLIPYNGNPPAAVLLALPFGYLDFDRAFIAWNIFSLGCLAVSIMLVFRDPTCGFSVWILLPVVAFLLLGRPLAEQVQMGQLSLLVLALLSGAWSAQRKSFTLLSGALIGLATAIKLFPGLLLVFFFLRRDWKAVAAGIGTFVAINGLCVVAFGTDCFLTYVSDIVPHMGQYYDGWMNVSLKGFWTKLFDARSGHVIPLWQNAALSWFGYAISCCIVMLTLAWSGLSAKSQRCQDLTYGNFIIAMVLLSPVAWDHYYLLLLIPLGLFWNFARDSTPARIFLVLAIIVLGVIKPQWIWDATIPGDGELAFGSGLQRSIAEPLHTLTVISYPLYILVALFVFGAILFYTTLHSSKSRNLQ